MRLLIMGAPGAGKGTQARDVAAHYRIPAISTGDIFRSNVAAGTPLGRQVDQILKAGEYVPDELTEQIVIDRLEQPDAANGWLLDGFPRTLHQVDALDDYLDRRHQQLDAVISLEVDPEELITRLLKRATIEGRADDNEQTIRHRMQVYMESTQPLLDTYGSRGLVLRVDGVGTVEEVGARIIAALDARMAHAMSGGSKR